MRKSSSVGNILPVFSRWGAFCLAAFIISSGFAQEMTGVSLSEEQRKAVEAALDAAGISQQQALDLLQQKARPEGDVSVEQRKAMETALDAAGISRQQALELLRQRARPEKTTEAIVSDEQKTAIDEALDAAGISQQRALELLQQKAGPEEAVSAEQRKAMETALDAAGISRQQAIELLRLKAWPEEAAEAKPEKAKKRVPAEAEFSSLEDFFGRRLSPDVSRKLRQFGYEIFTGPSTTFAPVENVPVGPDYVLGTGDNLIVYVWGKVIQETMSVTVDRDGKINLPQAGNVYVWGLKFSEAEALIKNTLAQYYANLNLSVTMGRLRTIKVFVLGEVKKPGGYTISSLSTVFHSLYEAGGPTKLGSMRQVKLIRDNQVLAVVDLYRFLLQGDKSQDLRLQSGDTVFVPPIGSISAVAGNVKRPGVYELLGEARISDLLAMSGGLTPAGYLKRLQLERVKDRERKIVIDLQLKTPAELEKSEQNVPVQDGDLVLVFPILPKRYNYVSIRGCVQRAGDYELESGMKVGDLLAKAGGIREGAYTARAEISRYEDERRRKIVPVNLDALFQGREDENLLLQQWDELTVYTVSEVIPDQYVEISGPVYKPGTYKLTPEMKLSDLIFRAGGLKPMASLANAELFRKGLGEPSRVLKVDLPAMGEEPEPLKDLLLQPDDHLYVREESEWGRKRIITLKGEFKYPGQYVAEKDETLSSILKRAGGFTEEAFLNGAVFTREAVKKSQEEMVAKFIKSEQESLLREETALSASDLSEQEREAGAKRMEERKELIRLISSIEIPGRVLINLDQPDKLAGTKSDVAIVNGDALYVPPVPSSVQLVGSVYNPTSVVYETGRNAKFYLGKVGGMTRRADKKEVYIIRANGEVVREFALLKEIRRGDTIVVPEEFKVKTNWGKVTLDASTVLYHLAIGAAVVNN